MLISSRRGLLLSALLFSPVAFAVEPVIVKDDPASQFGPGPSDFTLNRTLVTANRSAVSNLKSPYAANAVSGQTIEQKGFRTTPESLQEVPGVLVQKTSQGQGSPFIRGFTGFRTLFLIDGIRLNNSTFREGPNQYWATVDPFSIDRLEVVKGPASVLYGSDAIGGTVQAITKSPWTYGDGWQAGVNQHTRSSSAEHSFAIHPEVSLTNGDRLGILAMGSFKNYGDLEGGRDIGHQDNTDYSEGGMDLKMEYFFNPDTKLVFAYQYFRQNNVPRTHSTVFAESYSGSVVGSDLRRDLDQERQLAYVQLHADNVKNSFFDSAVASISWQGQFESEDRIRGTGARSVDEVNVGTLGLWTQFISKTPIGELSYGVEWYRDSVSSSSSSNPIQGPVADDSTYDLAGVYVQDRITLAKQWELTLGGRYTYAAVDANSVLDPLTGDRTSIDDSWDSLVGNARLSYFAIPDHLTFYGGASQGFRAPGLSDLTRLDVARSGERELPSPGLDPEYYTSFEGGAKFTDRNFSLQAAYYYTLIDDQIIRTPTGAIDGDGNAIVGKSNDGDGYVQGIELGLAYRFQPEWTFFGTIAWQDGEIDGFPTSAAVKQKEPVSRLMPLSSLLGLRYEPNKKLFIESTVFIAAGQDDLSSGDQRDTQRIPPGGTPGYTTVNVRGGYRFNKNLAMNVAVENIFDEDYRVHGSGTNSPGRNFIFGLTLSY